MMFVYHRHATDCSFENLEASPETGRVHGWAQSQSGRQHHCVKDSMFTHLPINLSISSFLSKLARIGAEFLDSKLNDLVTAKVSGCLVSLTQYCCYVVFLQSSFHPKLRFERVC